VHDSIYYLVKGLVLGMVADIICYQRDSHDIPKCTYVYRDTAMSDQPAHPYQKVHTFLRQHPMGILSTVADDGTPWGSAIYYVCDEHFKFYFVTRVETFKYDNIDKNPLAALTVADNESQTTVQVTGSVTRLAVKDYMDIVFGKLAHIRPKDDATWAPPLEKLHDGNYMPLVLSPTKMQFADYKDLKSDIHADYIEKIIPAK
jgi:uncharacterized pyridoxamine 5'-phosphate oxidase family protein